MRWKWRGVARKLHLDMRELVGCLILAEEGRRSGSTVSRAAAELGLRRRWRELVGEVASTGSGRRGGVVELLEIDAKLMEGLD